jgi:ergothioneine biosynthesis protein EgtB
MVRALELRSGALALTEQFTRVRDTTLDLCAGLSAEDCMVQSLAEGSPVKWHLAHTAWFFETFILARQLQGYTPLDARYRDLFNSYYNAVGEQPLKSLRAIFSRPSFAEVLEYREHVDSHMHALLAQDLSPDIESLVTLGIHHEQQHQELIITDLKHAFWSNPLRPALRSGVRANTVAVPAPMRWIRYPGATVEIGCNTSAGDFCFDNETPRHQQAVAAFQLASRLVTNLEFIEFIEDGGYRRPELWLDLGWRALHEHLWRAPLYWELADGHWRVFTTSGMRDLDLNEPVCHVSYFEAEAFARWAGARLATEAEWESAAGNVPVEGNLLESGALHPQAVAFTENTTYPHQLFGDCWEWTASPYIAYPRFRAASGAVGEYNGKFMCDQWVLRGGSCATPKSHIRPTYRNFFPASARWQFAGVRLAKDA